MADKEVDFTEIRKSIDNLTVMIRANINEGLLKEEVTRLREKLSMADAQIEFLRNEDTEKKIAQLSQELSHMRATAHKTRTEALQAAIMLAKLHLATPPSEAVFASAQERTSKFMQALENLIKLNEARSEVVGDAEAENAGEVAI